MPLVVVELEEDTAASKAHIPIFRLPVHPLSILTRKVQVEVEVEAEDRRLYRCGHKKLI